MSYLKNTASQRFNVLAINSATGSYVTGDAANITAKISIDSAAFASVADTNPTELDATNAPGVYVFDLSQAETNGDVLTIVPSSTTANVQMDMLNIYTVDPATYKADVTGLATAIALGVTDGKCTSILTDTGTSIPAQITALNDFDPASDTVANVTLVATTTTNTDMRGTDNAAAASSLSITNSSVNTIKTVTDVIPDSGTMTSIATRANQITIDGKANDIKAKTDQMAFTVANQIDANSLTGGTSASAVASAVWSEIQSSYTTVGTFGYYLNAQVSSTIHGTVEANLIQVQGQTVTLDDLNLFIDYWNPLQGDVLQLTQGDTYQTSINTQITITDTGFIDLSALSNNSCELTIRDLGTGQNILEDHQSVTVDNTTKTITFELTGTQTSGSDWLVHNNYKYRIAARFPTNKVVTLLRGSAIIADSLD